RSGEQKLTPIDEDGATNKAWELLAFLAAQPGGAAPKEWLLAALWPDVGEARAANRMHRAMGRLRGTLGRQVPGLPADVARCERDGTCLMDTTVIWSDAQRFWALCSAARTLPPNE